MSLIFRPTQMQQESYKPSTTRGHSAECITLATPHSGWLCR